MTEEILRDLARVDGLAVRSRHSSFAFRDRTRDLRTIGEELRANLAVTGSVQRSGDQVRVTAQLVDVANDRPLWADRFDRTIASSGELFALVDEIARGIVNELRLSIGAGRRRYDVDLDAYEKYLEARELVERRGVLGPARRARAPRPARRRRSRRSRRRTPREPTRTGTCRCAPISRVYGAGSARRMRQAATRAIELDPLLAEGHAAMGVVHARDRDWKRAEESFERASTLDRTLTPVYTSYSLWVLRPLGRFVEAERILLEALANDPCRSRWSARSPRSTSASATTRKRSNGSSACSRPIPIPVRRQVPRPRVGDRRPTEKGLALLEAESAAGPELRLPGLRAGPARPPRRGRTVGGREQGLRSA